MKKKLKLDADALTVVSFTSSAVRNEGGTVGGYVKTTECTASGATHCNSDVVDCADTADRSCFTGCDVLTSICM